MSLAKSECSVLMRSSRSDWWCTKLDHPMPNPRSRLAAMPRALIRGRCAKQNHYRCRNDRALSSKSLKSFYWEDHDVLRLCGVFSRGTGYGRVVRSHSSTRKTCHSSSKFFYEYICNWFYFAFYARFGPSYLQLVDPIRFITLWSFIDRMGRLAHWPKDFDLPPNSR